MRPRRLAANVGPGGNAWSDAFEAMRPCSTGGTYVNFLTEEEGAQRVEAAYGKANLDRFGELKRKWDPQDFFRHTKRVSS